VIGKIVFIPKGRRKKTSDGGRSNSSRKLKIASRKPFSAEEREGVLPIIGERRVRRRRDHREENAKNEVGGQPSHCRRKARVQKQKGTCDEGAQGKVDDSDRLEQNRAGCKEKGRSIGQSRVFYQEIRKERKDK